MADSDPTSTETTNTATTSETTTKKKKKKIKVVFQVGDRIVLTGLKRTPELNGIKGEVTAVLEKKKYNVKLDNGSTREMIHVKFLIKDEVSDEIKKKKESDHTASGLSAWNKAGTWEEKVLNDWSFAKIRELCSDLNLDEDASSITINVTEVTGDRCGIIFTRGKPRYGFDLNIKGTVKGEISGHKVNCEFRIPEVDESSFKDNDYVIKLKGAPSGTRKQLKVAIRRTMQTKLQVFVEELQKQ